MKILFLLLCLSALLPAAAENIVSVYPETAGLPVSKEWKLSAGGKNVILYTTGTLSGKNASFGGFDFSGRAELVIHSARPVRSAVVRPLSLGIRPEITGNLIRFSVGKPCRLTVEINGSVESALHVFANPPEEDVPSPGDPNVVYFGPGLHEIATLELESGQTLYLAPGAIVRAGIPADEKNIESKTYCGFKGYKEMVSAVKKENVAVRGRGILDMSDLPWHSRRTLWFLDSRNILVEGITMLNSATWTIVAGNCENVTIRNVKQIASEDTSSDGVDLLHCRDVVVEDCFMRNDDDAICVKTPWGGEPARNILVQRCVIWNERARGLGLISETRRDIENVTFRDCDIIHDFSDGHDCAALGILVSDAGTMKNTVFEDIRIEDSTNTLIYCWIGSDVWGQDDRRGHIRDTVFRNIRYLGNNTPKIRLSGFGADHPIRNLTIENLVFGGRKITKEEELPLEKNQFVEGLLVK